MDINLILKELSLLSVLQRAEIAYKLLDSVEVDEIELSDEWRQELERRVADIAENKVMLISSDEVFASVRHALK